MTNKDFSCNLQENYGIAICDLLRVYPTFIKQRTKQSHCCSALARQNGENGNTDQGADGHRIQNTPLLRFNINSA